MATMARETWTDERLDDLKDGMHREFDQVHTEFRDLRSDMSTEFCEERLHTNTEFRELRSEMNSRFDSMQRTIVLGNISIFAALVGAIFAKGIF